MTKSLIGIILLLSLNTFAQNIIVEKVKLIETIDNKVASEIPRVKDLANPTSATVTKINGAILELYMINSFSQRELEDFRWMEATFTSQIKDNILFISYEGEYIGAYPNHNSGELFFNLTTGEEMHNTDIPFHSLFTLSGYLDFLNRYWLKEAKEKFKQAVQCASSDPSCNTYDIATYKAENNRLVISLTDDCYPHAAQACSPTVTASVPLDSLKRYLNDIGKKMLFEDRYTSKTGIDKFSYNEKTKKDVPNQLFLFGKIDFKYAFSMALAVTKNSNSISGYYYYDRVMKKIDLKGTVENNKMILTESLNGSVSGGFVLQVDKESNGNGLYVYGKGGDDSKYLSGTWADASKTKSLKIEFTVAKLSDQ